VYTREAEDPAAEEFQSQY